MFLGISSYSFPWATGIQGFAPPKKLSALELLQFAIAYKIKYVQFGDNMPLHLLSKEELVEVKDTADESGIRLQVGTKGLTISNIEKYLAIAQTLSSSFLRIVIDDDEYHPDEKEVKQLIRKILPLLKENRIILAIENHDRFSAGTLQSIILENDAGLVGICLDTANSLGAGEGINEVLNVLGPYAVNLHIKDIRIQRMNHKMGFIVEGTASGDGMLDIPRIIHELDQTGKCTTATLELWSEPEDTIELTLIKEKQQVEKSIHYLKRILV